MNPFKLFFSVLFFSIFQNSAIAQIGNPAPDFTVTDTHGETHQLYDYLDDGKIVVLDFFYTTCGPCQFYTPQVNLAWDFYGCNSKKVFFMGIDWGDTDSEVLAYDDEYNVPYPSISGVDGGGNEVVNQYNVTGFPTFYVIDSSKTIIDDIYPPTLPVFDYRFSLIGIVPTDCVTSTSELPSEENIHLFPNPISDGDLIFELPKSKNGKAIVQVFNLFGQQIFKDQFNLNERSYSIPVDHLTSGIYLVKINAKKSGTIYSGKFTKI